MIPQRSRRPSRLVSLRGRERPVPRRSRFREELDPFRRGMLLVLGLLTVIILGVAAIYIFGDPHLTTHSGSGSSGAGGAGTASLRAFEADGGNPATASSGGEPSGTATTSPSPPLGEEGGGARNTEGRSRSGVAAGGSLWGYPFVGYGLDEIGRELSARYAGKAPRSWGENLPGVTTRLESVPKASGPVVALTLDACDGRGEAGYDAGLIDFLRERRIPATLFVTSLWARANPQRLKELAADPLFEIGAHGMRHQPSSVNGRSVYGIKGTASINELVEEVEGNARELHRATGRRARWFRSGAAFYDDIAVRVIHDLGLHIAGYTIAADEGASLSASKVAAKTVKARNGDIILAHMNHPDSGTREGLMEALTRMQAKGYLFIRLSDVLDLPASR